MQISYKGITIYFTPYHTWYLYKCGQTHYFSSALAAKLFITKHMKGHVNYVHEKHLQVGT